LGVRGAVEFVVDTGAEHALLSEADARALNIPYRNFPEGEPAVGVGGQAMTWKIEKRVCLSLRTTTGRIFKAWTSEIQVLEGSENLPSLIGLDFLADINIKFVYDAPTRSAWFEW
jgi:predicted aspartyl protease